MQILVTYLGAFERVAIAFVLLDVIVLKAALGRGFEDPAPVDDPLADLGKRSRTVVASGAGGKARFKVFDVKLQETTGKTIEIIHRILAGAHAPEAIELEIGKLGIGAPKEFVVLDHSIDAGKIEIVAVVEKVGAGFVRGLAHLVEPIGITLDGVEGLPVPVIEAGQADVRNAALAGVRDAFLELGFELLRGEMRADRVEATRVEQAFEFRRLLPVKIEGPADLHILVSNFGNELEGARQILFQMVADGVELYSDGQSIGIGGKFGHARGRQRAHSEGSPRDKVSSIQSHDVVTHLVAEFVEHCFVYTAEPHVKMFSVPTWVASAWRRGFTPAARMQYTRNLSRGLN